MSKVHISQQDNYKKSFGIAYRSSTIFYFKKDVFCCFFTPPPRRHVMKSACILKRSLASEFKFQDQGKGTGNFEVPNSQFPGARSLLYRHF